MSLTVSLVFYAKPLVWVELPVLVFVIIYPWKTKVTYNTCPRVLNSLSRLAPNALYINPVIGISFLIKCSDLCKILSPVQPTMKEGLPSNSLTREPKGVQSIRRESPRYLKRKYYIHVFKYHYSTITPEPRLTRARDSAHLLCHELVNWSMETPTRSSREARPKITFSSRCMRVRVCNYLRGIVDFRSLSTPGLSSYERHKLLGINSMWPSVFTYLQWEFLANMTKIHYI